MDSLSEMSHHHDMFQTLTKLLATLALTCAFALSPIDVMADTVDVSADGQTYVVDGGVIHHSRYDKDRVEASTCETCHWRISVMCRSWDDAVHGWCPSMLVQCPRDERLAEVFRADSLTRPPSTSTLWHRTGYTCLGDGGPASTVRIREAIRESWRIEVPHFVVTTSPPTNTIVNFPTRVNFQSSATTGQLTRSVAGIPVTFRATALRSYVCKPVWLCAYSTSALGSIHFLRIGEITLYATARWNATYDALGLSGLPVTDDPVIQQAITTVQVTSLHRHLK